jgi:hypothetical protein
LIFFIKSNFLEVILALVVGILFLSAQEHSIKNFDKAVISAIHGEGVGEVPHIYYGKRLTWEIFFV